MKNKELEALEKLLLKNADMILSLDTQLATLNQRIAQLEHEGRRGERTS